MKIIVETNRAAPNATQNNKFCFSICLLYTLFSPFGLTMSHSLELSINANDFRIIFNLFSISPATYHNCKKVANAYFYLLFDKYAYQ